MRKPSEYFRQDTQEIFGCTGMDLVSLPCQLSDRLTWDRLIDWRMIPEEDGSPSVYSSSERAVKITLQRTRQDDSQRRLGSMCRTGSFMWQKRRSIKAAEEIQREREALTQQHSKKVYKFVINYVFRLLVGTSIYPGASKTEDISSTSAPVTWFSFWIIHELHVQVEIKQGFSTSPHKTRNKN